MLIKNEERVFVSDELKDIVSLNGMCSDYDSLKFVVGNESFSIKKIKVSKKKIKLTFYCDLDVIKNLFENKYEFAFIKIYDEETYKLNLKNNLIYFIFNKELKSSCKICISRRTLKNNE